MSSRRPLVSVLCCAQVGMWTRGRGTAHFRLPTPRSVWQACSFSAGEAVTEASGLFPAHVGLRRGLTSRFEQMPGSALCLQQGAWRASGAACTETAGLRLGSHVRQRAVTTGGAAGQKEGPCISRAVYTETTDGCVGDCVPGWGRWGGAAAARHRVFLRGHHSCNCTRKQRLFGRAAQMTFGRP